MPSSPEGATVPGRSKDGPAGRPPRAGQRILIDGRSSAADHPTWVRVCSVRLVGGTGWCRVIGFPGRDPARHPADEERVWYVYAPGVLDTVDGG